MYLIFKYSYPYILYPFRLQVLSSMGLFGATSSPVDHIAAGCRREVLDAFLVCAGYQYSDHNHFQLSGLRIVDVVIFAAGVLVGVTLVPSAASIGSVRRLTHSLIRFQCCNHRRQSRFDDDELEDHEPRSRRQNMGATQRAPRRDRYVGYSEGEW